MCYFFRLLFSFILQFCKINSNLTLLGVSNPGIFQCPSQLSQLMLTVLEHLLNGTINPVALMVFWGKSHSIKKNFPSFIYKISKQLLLLASALLLSVCGFSESCKQYLRYDSAPEFLCLHTALERLPAKLYTDNDSVEIENRMNVQWQLLGELENSRILNSSKCQISVHLANKKKQLLIKKYHTYHLVSIMF